MKARRALSIAGAALLLGSVACGDEEPAAAAAKTSTAPAAKK